MKNCTNSSKAGVTTKLSFVFGLFLMVIHQIAMAQTDCRWDGTAPTCNGTCKVGESEMTRLGIDYKRHCKTALQNGHANETVIEDESTGTTKTTQPSRATTCWTKIGSDR